MTIIIAILIFCVIIIVHECGHFFAAKSCGMKIDEFAIGMGPKLLQSNEKGVAIGFGDKIIKQWERKKAKKSETTFCWRLLPIGGSVSLGEDEETEDPRSFRNKPVWQRMIVIVAGAIMNLILGLIVCLISIASGEYITTTKVAGFYENSATAQYLQAEDEIININGLPIWSSMDIAYALQNSVAEREGDSNFVTYEFTVLRNGAEVNIPAVTFAVRESEDGTSSPVLDFYVRAAEKDFGGVISESGRMFMSEARLIWISVIDLISGRYGLNDLSGPVGVVQTVSNAATTMSLSQILSLVAFITINVGIFNLLPIPALDGARFLFLLIEAIRRKPIKAEYEGMVHFIGFAALMLLMIVVTFQDVGRLFG